MAKGAASLPILPNASCGIGAYAEVAIFEQGGQIFGIRVMHGSRHILGERLSFFAHLRQSLGCGLPQRSIFGSEIDGDFLRVEYGSPSHLHGQLQRLVPHTHRRFSNGCAAIPEGRANAGDLPRLRRSVCVAVPCASSAAQRRAVRHTQSERPKKKLSRNPRIAGSVTPVSLTRKLLIRPSGYFGAIHNPPRCRLTAQGLRSQRRVVAKAPNESRRRFPCPDW